MVPYFALQGNAVAIFSDEASVGTVPILIVYLLANIALPLHVLATDRDRFRLVRHILIPLAGPAVLFYGVYEFVQPNQPPVEVEGTLLRHAAVQEAAIVGLPHEKWGEAPHAYVVLREGASATGQEMIAFARDRLAHFKAPHGVTFVPDLPKTATGKLQKYVLRDGALNLAGQ